MNSNTSPLRDESQLTLAFEEAWLARRRRTWANSAGVGEPPFDWSLAFKPTFKEGWDAALEAEVRSLRSQGELVYLQFRTKGDGWETEYICDPNFPVGNPALEYRILYASPPSQPIASDVVAAPEPKREPITNPHNWFPALHAIVEVWKSQGDYKADALDKMIASASRDIDESRELYAKASLAAPDVLSRQSPVEADRFQISSGPITPAEAINLAFDLETAIGEILNGTRKPGKMPVEPIAKLIQFVRDEALRTPVAASPSDTSQGVSEAPAGFTLMYVSGFQPLMDALGRASCKGYMPDSMAEEWEVFDYRAALRSEPEQS